MYIQPLEKVGPNQRFSPPNLWKSTFEKGGAKMGVYGGFAPVLIQIDCVGAPFRRGDGRAFCEA